MELEKDFYKNLLERLTKLFEKEEMALLHYKDDDGKDVIVLAQVKVNSISQNLDIKPFANFWNRNPGTGITPVKLPILAIQKPLNDWNEEAKATMPDPMLLN